MILYVDTYPPGREIKKCSAILKKMAATLKRYRLLFNAISQELLNQITLFLYVGPYVFCMWETNWPELKRFWSHYNDLHENGVSGHFFLSTFCK